MVQASVKYIYAFMLVVVLRNVSVFYQFSTRVSQNVALCHETSDRGGAEEDKAPKYQGKKMDFGKALNKS